MKTLFLTATLITVLFSTGVFSQKITYKEVIGTWDKKDTAKEKLTFKFIDTSNLNVQSSVNGSSDFTYKLITDSSKGQIIIQMNSNTDGIKYSLFYKLQRMNINTLRLTNLNSNDPIVQNPEDINNGTFYLVKRS